MSESQLPSLGDIEKYASEKFGVASIAVEIDKGEHLAERYTKILLPIISEHTLFRFCPADNPSAQSQLVDFLRRTMHYSYWFATPVVECPDMKVDSRTTVAQMQTWLRSYNAWASKNWESVDEWINKPVVRIGGNKDALVYRIQNISSMIKKDGLVQQRLRDRLVKEIDRFADSMKILAEKIYPPRLGSESSDIEVVSVSVSIYCPISQRKILRPVKGIRCTHLQAFDQEGYEMLAQQRKYDEYPWRCPVCEKNYTKKEIVFDSGFEYRARAMKKKSNVVELSSDSEEEPNPHWIEKPISPAKRVKERHEPDIARTEHGTRFLRAFRARQLNASSVQHIGGVDESDSHASESDEFLSSYDSSFSYKISHDHSFESPFDF